MPKGHANSQCSDAERYYVPEPNSGCWLWDGHVRDDGYARFWLRGKEHFAHRVMYELEKGPVPEGLVLDHLCRVKTCVNPRHLEAVTVQVNRLRGVGAGGTHCRHGHLYDEANTYRPAHGMRVCRACNAASSRRARQRFRETGSWLVRDGTGD